MPSRPAVTPGPAPQPSSPFDHVFLIVFENHDYVTIVGDAVNAPFINNTLIPAGTLLSQYSGANLGNVSLGNYFRIESGSDFGITDDLNPPSNHVQILATECLADLIEGAGKTWRSYAENYPGGAGGTTITDGDSSPYVEHHSPMLYHQSVRTMPYRCLNVQDFTNFTASKDFSTTVTTTTPNFAVIIGNNNDNMHDGTVSAGDTWLNTQVGIITGSKAWTTRRCLLIFVFDESTHGANGERVVCVFQGSQGSVKANITVSTTYEHRNLCRTIEWALGTGQTANGEASFSRITEPFN